MPRPRESRHDNGLVGPGKRIAPKKSHGQLDGPARSPDNGALAGPSSPPPTNGPNGVGKHDAGAALATPPAAPLDGRSGDGRRGSLGTSSESSSSEMSGASMAANGVDGTRQIDVNALKNADVHRDSGPLDLVSTVVRSLPVQDTLAILIILMHLPYVSLTIVYGLFATLTFVPPVMSKVGWNMNLGDIMDGISQMPSLATTLAMDFFFFLVWVFLWPPIQDFMLEFAKPVVAVTLGGGAIAKDGSSRGVTACFIWMFLHKLVRASRVYWPRLARHVPDGWRMPAMLSDSFLRPSASHDRRDGHGWLQSIMAIHILTQGIVRYVREWYLRRERFNSTDPEAGKPGTVVASSTVSSGNDTTTLETGLGAAMDTEAGLSSTSSAAVAKRRRKQSAQVRLQQPLWAALASTKIVAMKEYEISNLRGPTNKNDIHNSGSTPSFDGQPRQIWISYIGSDEVCFNTSHFPELDGFAKANGHSAATPAGVDTSKPFYVRINNAFWQPTRILPIDDEKETRWTGDIYGLRPAAKYVCEFVDTQTDQVIFTTSIRTVKETLREADLLSTGMPNGQQALRPDSPATTLRTSIAAAEARLADEKNRLKTWRKEWKNRVNALKKENEGADNQLATAGNSDEKFKQKIRQQETQKSQAERDTERVADQLKNFDTAPSLPSKKAERGFSAEKKVFDGAQKEFKCHKSQLEEEVKGREVEKSNLNTRRNKIATRIAKIENELANITDANNRGLDEAERRRQDRGRLLEQVAAIENNYADRTSQVLQGNNAKREHMRSLETQLQAFQAMLNNAVNKGMPIEVPPMVPEHQPYGQSAWNPNPAAPPHFPTGPWGASSGDMHPAVPAPTLPPGLSWHPPPTAPAFEPRGARSRGRSSSMLSDVSGFTEGSDELAGSRPARRNGAHGSNSSGSIGDPSSPA
ncbi:LOW QUALITY PROTEIN: fungal transcriptional regulatory protein [Purpureocillium lavendulum]|uniref:Fungal transcriptional regulatory protein n=1 Tax=Purpureocillium lavendulum TaxID=1247861 RepID=A0AB34FF77_9HYPO|nr:LOW QUALITY PROTEIN: fungal transcriptional regulatory protein [Purpureocillium lavendulum]